MNGELRNPKTGAVIAKGRVTIEPDGRRGTIDDVPPSHSYSVGPNEHLVLRLDSGKEYRIVITSTAGPGAVAGRAVGGFVTEFNISRD